MTWKHEEKRFGTDLKARDVWESEDGIYWIVVASNGKHRLISHIHEGWNGTPWFKDFTSLQDAQEYSEMI